MLRDWFSSLPGFEHKSTENFSVLIASCQEEALTGLLRFESPSGDLYLWIFANGEGKSFFKYENNEWRVFHRSELMSKQDGYQVNIYKVPIPIQGVRICETLLTGKVKRISSVKLLGADLLQQVQDWFDRQNTGFIFAQTENLGILGLTNGDGVSNLEVLFRSESEVTYSVEQPDDLPIEANKEYQVEFYSGDEEQDTWLKNRLRLAFASLLRMMIQRFGYMVGFVLADRLSAKITEANNAQSLNIEISINGIKNNHLFDSLQDAREAYSFILNSFLEQASTLIGLRMSKDIALNMLEKLNPAQRELLITNLDELKSPQFNLASAPRKQ